MNRTCTLIGTMMVVVAGVAMAQTVAVPNTFSSGDTISAAEMNENFDAIEDGINANAAANPTTSDTFVTVPGLSRAITCGLLLRFSSRA